MLPYTQLAQPAYVTGTNAAPIPSAPPGVDGLYSNCTNLHGRLLMVRQTLDNLLSRLNGPAPQAIGQGSSGPERLPAIGELMRCSHEVVSEIEKQAQQLLEAIG